MRLFLSLFILSLLIFSSAAQEDASMTFAYTHHQPDGNRLIAGSGTFPDVQTVDFGLQDGEVAILLEGMALDAHTLFWKFTTAQGNIHTVEAALEGGTVREAAPVSALPPGAMPLVARAAGGIELIGAEGGSGLSFPAPIGESILFIDRDGTLILSRGSEILDTSPLHALPDGRIVINRAGQIAVYVGATNQRYVHGVLGDDYEAAGLAVLEIVEDQIEIKARIDLPGDDVFEGLSPLWADIDEDGAEELIVTVSNGAVGAQLRAYRADASLLATGPAVGRGGRWRHQLAAAPFGLGGEMELVDVLTPHIGGIVEFFRLNGDRLEVVASLSGYTSHVIGSRNLDMAVSGDFNGDGRLEIVLPTQNRTVIAGLQRTSAGIEEVWSLPLDGVLVSNVSAVTLPDQSLALAAGLSDGRVRIWLPK